MAIRTLKSKNLGINKTQVEIHTHTKKTLSKIIPPHVFFILGCECGDGFEDKMEDYLMK